MQNKKIFIFLIIIIIALALTKLFQFLTPQIPTPTPLPSEALREGGHTPTPFIISTPISTPAFSLNQIISQLPIVTPKYTIEYSDKIQKFIVVILQNPYEENKTLVKNWFKSQGVQDLSKLNIRFVTARGVAP